MFFTAYRKTSIQIIYKGSGKKQPSLADCSYVYQLGERSGICREDEANSFSDCVSSGGIEFKSLKRISRDISLPKPEN